MSRRTPEEKQAKREQREAEKRAKLEERAADKRAAFERRIAGTAAADAAKKAEVQRQHDAFVASVAKQMADGSPMKFPSLGVTIHDGNVYKTSDVRPFGPLAGA